MVSLSLGMALIDAAAGLYLLHYAVRRQRSDKGALLVTAVFLLVCALALGWHWKTSYSRPHPSIPSLRGGWTAPVGHFVTSLRR